MTATVTRAPGEDGVLYAQGTQNAGFSLFVQDDRLCFDYNAFGDHTLVTSEVPIPADATHLSVRFERTGQTGAAELRIDGDPCGRGDIAYTMRMMSSIGASIGTGANSPVSDQHTGRFPFGGTLHELTVDVDPSRTEREREAEAKARYDAEMNTQ
jgi:arylsulfatase